MARGVPHPNGPLDPPLYPVAPHLAARHYRDLYQEATSLATGNNVAADDPRRQYVSYANDHTNETAKAPWSTLEQRITTHDDARTDQPMAAPERTR